MTLSASTKANRKNAKRSTGPKSTAGKLTVSKNAVSHGIYMKTFINEGEEARYQMFLDDLQREYPSENPIIKAQIERLAKTKTLLDRIQKTIDASFANSEDTERSDEALMDFLGMDESQREVAQKIIEGSMTLDKMINVKRTRVASELAHLNLASLTSNDDYLYHAPIFCKYLVEESKNFEMSIERFIDQIAANLVNSSELGEKFLNAFSTLLEREPDSKIDEEWDLEVGFPAPPSIESEINKLRLISLKKAAEIFKKEHNKLADLHHKVITFNKLRSYEFSPIPLDLDQLDKLLRFQGSLQNQYSKILGELLALTSNK